MASILVADDEDGIRKLLKESLEKKGHKVETAASGSEALEKVKKAPDLILLDAMMADMDAMEVLDKVIEISPTTEVIMVSGLSQYVTNVRVPKAQVDFATRSVDLKHLEQLIDIKIIRSSVKRKNNHS